jgi:CO/xanthine dehydrogenase Mo-binding subunit
VPPARFNPAAVPAAPHVARTADKRLLTGTPRHVGDGVAVVVADHADHARRAVIDPPVRWEPRPAVLTADEALRAGRIVCRVRMADPGVDPLLAEAALVVDRSVTLDPVQHVCLEPHACAAIPEPDGSVTVWTNTQSPADIRRLVCAVLGLPTGLVRVRKVTEGGGFGAKQEMYEEALVGWLAARLNRPVRLAYTRDEEFVASRVRHGGRLRLRAGFDGSGRLLAGDLDALLDAGAYASHSPYVLSCVGGHLSAAYPGVRQRFHGCAVYTNTVPAGAYRGYGVAEAATLVEQAVDEAARALGRSPVAVRLASLRDTGAAARTRCCLDRLESLPPLPTAAGGPHLLRGTGYAIAVKSSVTEPSSDRSRATVRVDGAGAVTLATGTCDCGTGSSVALARIVADTLGMAEPAVTVLEGDTARVPADLGSSAQRSVFVGGQAAATAASALRDTLIARAATASGRDPAALALRWPGVVAPDTGDPVATVADLVDAEPGGELTASADRMPVGDGASVCALRVQVAVDPGTGEVRVEDATVVVDCGAVVHPLGAHGQVVGATAQGIGLALIDSAAGGAGSVLAHGVPRSMDVPPVRVVFAGDGTAPPSGVGELAVVPVPAAIGNAVSDATGVRCDRFPLRPATVRAALGAGAGR